MVAWLKRWWSNRKAKSERIRMMRKGPNTIPKPEATQNCQVYQNAINTSYWVQDEIDCTKSLCHDCAEYFEEAGGFIQVVGATESECSSCSGEQDL